MSANPGTVQRAHQRELAARRLFGCIYAIWRVVSRVYGKWLKVPCGRCYVCPFVFVLGMLLEKSPS